MRFLGSIFLIGVLLVSCEQENPAPDSFVDYDMPFNTNLVSQRLIDLDRKINEGIFGDIHSLIIVRNDKIVFENYYSDYHRSELHPMGASTQSVVSALIGAAFADDSLLNTSMKIVEKLPTYAPYFDNVPQKDQIELGHLMSYSSGFWWDEWAHPFGSAENDAYAMSLSEDWIADVLSTPMIREPGFEFNYNSGNAVLMAPILEHITGVEMEQYATEKIFDPLDITDWKWERIPGDMVNSSWGLHLKPIDMAKIGYLFLKKGVWNGSEIFEENWSNISSRRRKSISNFYDFGYLWWRFSFYADAVRNLRENDVYFSWGAGGQFIFVVPHLNMVIVSTAGNYSNNDIITFTILRDYIIEAVSDRF